MVALAGLGLGVGVSLRLLPPRPARHPRRRWSAMVLQWTLLPVTGLAYSAASALTSQTRLATGRYLEQFDVTEKAVVTESGGPGRRLSLGRQCRRPFPGPAA